MVEVFLPSILSSDIGRNRFSVSAGKVSDVICILIEQYGGDVERKLYDQDGEWIRFWQIFVNGVNIRFLDYFETKLDEGDRVAFLPVVDGG